MSRKVPVYAEGEFNQASSFTHLLLPLDGRCIMPFAPSVPSLSYALCKHHLSRFSVVAPLPH